MAPFINDKYFENFHMIFYIAIVLLQFFAFPSVNAIDPTCFVNITVLPQFSYYVQDDVVPCNSNGNYIFNVYEDCPTNVLIFEVTAGEDIAIESCNGELFSQGLKFGFTKGGNVEDPKRATLICINFITGTGGTNSFGTFSFLDVNEFPPQPVGGLDLVQSLYPDENTKGSILDFEYQDLDSNEISSMTFSNHFDAAAEAMFEIQEFGISNYTRSYSLVAKTELDFESNSYYSLQVTFTSEDVRGNSSSTDQVFIIFVNDLGDNPPVFTVFVPYANFSEGPPLEVFTVQAKDRDVMVNNHIKYNIVSGNELGYFVINEETGSVSTDKEIDREALDLVLFVLVIEATEYLIDGTVAPEPNSINQTTTVRVDDVNDVAPVFLGDYETLSYDENTPNGVIVMVLQTYDPDENDLVTYKISDNEYLQIEDENLGEISIKNLIDREGVDNFTVTLTIQDLVGQESAVDIFVTINDLNDNAPIITCAQSANITEGSNSGTPVETVSATDSDIGKHKEITYILKNLNNNDENKLAPFQIDEVTGEITVMNTQDMTLDRETMSQWELYIGAYDNCEDAEFKCSVNSDECIMTIYVIDENDNPPGNFQLNIGGNTITTDESLRKDDQIPGLEILAIDPDEPMTPNSEVNFEVSHLYIDSKEQTNHLFEADNFNRTGSYYCYLYALDDLTGQTGDYIITIKASDNGLPEQVQEHNFTLRINDVNDMTPEISLSDCLISSEQTITLIENITVVDEPLSCTPNAIPGNDATIYVTDKDADPPNSNVNLVIDYTKSTAENGGSQLQAFVIYRYPEIGTYGISINAEIDREKGSGYNLSLVASDDGVPQLSSATWVYIIVNDLNEYEPTFCDKAPCSQTLYITENTNDATAFLAATDFDNLSGDAPNGNTIYYFIVDDADHAFKISDSRVNEINPIIDLDRESIGEYHFNILTTNNRINPNEYRTPNQILQIIVIIVDQNDNKPFYDEIIYGDFTNTNQLKDTVAEIEFTDVDLNETLEYTIGDDMFWSDGQSIADPFIIEPIDSRRSKLLLNMDPKGKIGYCTFTVNCQDAGGHKASASALVLVVTSDYIVLFYFLNDLSTVTYNSNNIEDIFTTVFGYACVIDEISEAVDANNNVITGQTLVSAHFIEEIPVRVEEMTSPRMSGKGEPSSIQKRISFPKTLDQEIFEGEEKPTNNNGRKLQDINKERKHSINEEINSLFKRREEWKENRHLKSTPRSLSEKIRKDRIQISPENEARNSEKSKNRFLGLIPKLVENKTTKSNVNKTFTRARKLSSKASVTYQLVPKEEIEMMGTQGSVTSELTNQLSMIGLNLIRIGEVQVDVTNTLHKQIVSLKIGLGVVALVLGLLTILLLIVYVGKTRKLNRQIRVLTTNTFGSKSSELNKIGADMSQIPGSNIYAKDGTNPIWNKEFTLDGVNEDATSDTSGESVFEGVEEEPPFKNFVLQNNQTSGQPLRYDGKVNKSENLDSESFNAVRNYETPLSNGFRSFGRVNPLIVPKEESLDSSFNDNKLSNDRRTSSSIINDDGSGDSVMETNFNSNFSLY